MKLSEHTRKKIRQILRRTVTQEIPLRKRSAERRPGGGVRKSVFRGAGDDYDGSTEYTPGEDFREIDWCTYASSGRQDLLVNLYREPRDIQSFVIVDANRSMDFGSTRVSKRHVAAELTASCLKSLHETRDRAGLVLFADNVQKSLDVRPAKRLILPALATILDAPVADTADGAGGLSLALRKLPMTRSLVFVVSDFMNTSDEDWNNLRKAGKRHQVVCLFVQDVRERELPDPAAGATGFLGWILRRVGAFYTVRDWSGKRVTIRVTQKTRARYAANFLRHQTNVLARIKHAHCRSLIVSTEEGDKSNRKLMQMLSGKR